MAINEERMGYGDWAGQKGGGEPAGATAPLTKRGGVAVTRAARPTQERGGKPAGMTAPLTKRGEVAVTRAKRPTVRRGPVNSQHIMSNNRLVISCFVF